MMISGEQNRFGTLLRAYREQTGKTIPQVAAEIGVDRAYLWKLETQAGDWRNRPLVGAPAKQPSRDVIIALAFALNLALDDADELLLAAGYAPLLRLTRQGG